MDGLLLHRGGNEVTLDDLKLIETPPPTETYVPVPHYELATMARTVGQDILRDYILVGENYGIARQGNQLFAILKFQKDPSEMALSVAFRNSYDKSMSIGMAFGASVFCCDNLALRGDIVVMKKHTKNVWNELEQLTITQLYKSQNNFAMLLDESGRMKERMMGDNEAYKLLGLMYGYDVLSPGQLPVVVDQWLKPRHTEFAPRNAWSFYNAITEGLKSTAPINVMERHVKAHQMLLEAI